MRPTAKKEGLLIEELAGEALVYDLDNRMVHRLDQQAFQVWRSCDGHHTPEMIASTLTAEQHGEHLDADHLAVVETAVRQLRDAGLLLPLDEEDPSAKQPPTRRDLLARAGALGAAGAAGGALILVHSIAAPTPAMAASPLPSVSPTQPSYFA